MASFYIFVEDTEQGRPTAKKLRSECMKQSNTKKAAHLSGLIFQYAA